MHKTLLLTLLLAAGLSAQPADLQQVKTVLDDFHQAASEADGVRYFGHFAPQGVFLGTDITERWTVGEFREYAMPYFSKGKGWTYTPLVRHVDFSSDGKTAWFDETLKSQNYGDTRGSGVLVKQDDGWKIAQYHLTVPVPNDLLGEVVRMIQRKEKD